MVTTSSARSFDALIPEPELGSLYRRRTKFSIELKQAASQAVKLVAWRGVQTAQADHTVAGHYR